jgi:hypothetical protein
MDIPEELQFRDVRKQAPVIISKESRQVLPQNGTRFEQGDSGTTQIVFRLPNEENSSTDLSTMWITADLTVLNLPNTFTEVQCQKYNNQAKTIFDGVANATNAATDNLPFLSCCDSIESAIRQVHILVNGSELERHDYYNYEESILNMHTNNANFSNSIGAGCMLMNMNHYEKSKLFLQNATALRTQSNTIQVSFPLRWCGVANLRSLVPTYLLGGGQSAIEIRIFLENANKFLIAGVFAYTNTHGFSNDFTPAANLTYRLDNVRMNYDVVQTSDAYTSSLRSYLASNQLTLPIDTYYTTQFDIPSNQNGWLNFTISTQMSDISAVYIGFVLPDEQNSYAFASTDRFIKPHGLSEARLQINGKPYPNVNIRLSGDYDSPEAEAYQYLMKALRQNCSLEVIGNSNAIRDDNIRLRVNNASAGAALSAANLSIRDIHTASGTYYGVNKVPIVPVANLSTGAKAINYFEDDAYLFESPSSFILGFDISKSNYNNEYELSGQDLTKSSGLIQVNLKFEGANRVRACTGAVGADIEFPLAASQLNAIVVVKHKRILDIGLDSSQVIY